MSFQTMSSLRSNTPHRRPMSEDAFWKNPGDDIVNDCGAFMVTEGLSSAKREEHRKAGKRTGTEKRIGPESETAWTEWDRKKQPDAAWTGRGWDRKKQPEAAKDMGGTWIGHGWDMGWDMHRAWMRQDGYGAARSSVRQDGTERSSQKQRDAGRDRK